MSCLGIITARGGSKGVRDKNRRPLGDGPSLVQRAVAVARACPWIGEVAITTDSPEIADQARAAGAAVPFLRPAELSGDAARQEDAILHLMAHYEAADRRYAHICVLTPTNPFRTARTLTAAYGALTGRPGATAMISLAPAASLPGLCNTWDGSSFLADFPDRTFIFMNRQEFPAIFTVSGVVYLSEWDAYKEAGTIWQPRTMGFAVDDFEALDIDTPRDFFLADEVIRRGLTSAQALKDHVDGQRGGQRR